MTGSEEVLPRATARETLTLGWARFRDNWQAWLAVAALVLTMLTPLAAVEEGSRTLERVPVGWIGIVGAAALAAAARRNALALLAITGASFAGAAYALALLPLVEGRAATGYWAFVAACWLLGWLAVARLAEAAPPTRIAAVALRIAAPLLLGIWLLILWEIVVRALQVPTVVLPPPSAIGARIAGSFSVSFGGGFPFVRFGGNLWTDFHQTFLKAVLAGYAIGCGAAFLTALLVDRVDFLRRGLLPIGNLLSALPIVGVAPILVMWFGFGWPSKAAVVVVMVFFPGLVNTLAGLAAAGAMERDLMRTYAAGHWVTLVKLRLPAAMPFIFNALKISTTLALIGAIVAEFFGSPTAGMGFRISAAFGRVDIALVWAEIAVAALAGTAFYGLIALLERAITFWHPSHRR